MVKKNLQSKLLASLTAAISSMCCSDSELWRLVHDISWNNQIFWIDTIKVEIWRSRSVDSNRQWETVTEAAHANGFLNLTSKQQREWCKNNVICDKSPLERAICILNLSTEIQWSACFSKISYFSRNLNVRLVIDLQQNLSLATIEGFMNKTNRIRHLFIITAIKEFYWTIVESF